MAKIERKTQKIFAGAGQSNDLAAFGSMISGTPVYNDDIEVLQTPAYEQGWSHAIAANEAPFLEEMNGVQYGFSKQLAYLFQEGIAEYDENTTYYTNSICKSGKNLYLSLTDDNTGNNPATDTENWHEMSSGNSENNPFFFGMSLYSKSAPDNLSWLKSNGQWNEKTVYPDYYEWLLSIYNETETVEGVSVKASTATDITDYDYVINTTDETFKLPLLNGSENLPGTEQLSYPLPSANGQTYTAKFNGFIQVQSYTTAPNCYVQIRNITSGVRNETRNPISNGYNVDNVEVKAGDLFTITADVISNVTYVKLHKAIGNGSLYYYVGETVSNENLINAGEIAEALTAKVDTSNKQWAMNALMPDLSAKVQKAFGTTHTAESNGYLYGSALANASVASILTVNNVQIFYGSNSHGTTRYNYSWVLSEGDTYNMTVVLPNEPGQYLYFVPMKGVTENA